MNVVVGMARHAQVLEFLLDLSSQLYYREEGSRLWQGTTRDSHSDLKVIQAAIPHVSAADP